MAKLVLGDPAGRAVLSPNGRITFNGHLRGWIGSRRAPMLAVVVVAALPLSSAPQSTPPKTHPRLVSATGTNCGTCHQSLVQGKPHVHAPVADGCQSCHEAQTDAAGTRITLAAPGPALCLSCHDALAPASEGKLKASHPPVADSCVSCHDPHASSNERFLVSPVPELCTSCHEAAGLQTAHHGQLGTKTDCRECHAAHGGANPHMLLGSRQHTPFAEGSCDACHRAPLAGRPRLRARGEQLCAACHGKIAKPGTGSVHPALFTTRNAAGCLACHSPHMSDQAKLLRRPGPALCATCHGTVAKAAAAKTGHAPAREDCLNCHGAHSGSAPHLLADAPAQVCRGCHDASDAGLRKAHLGADLNALGCTTCHDAHGTGNAKLLARAVHAPVLDGCESCHEGAFNKLVESGESTLCLSCHEEVGAKAAKAKVPHAAIEAARCTECHNPHASAQEHLVKSRAGGPCLACHEGQAAGPGETTHGVIDVVGCRACHEPHGGDNPKLLRQVGNALCLGCHDARAVKAPEGASVRLLDRFEVPASVARALATLRLSADGTRDHPVPNHRVAGSPPPKHAAPVETTFKGELSCLTCHDPHKGRSRRVLRWNAASATEACLQCHPK